MTTEDRHIRECTYQGGPCICSLLSRYGARVRSKTSNKTALAERARIRQAVIDSANACDMAPEDMSWSYEAILSIINGDLVEQDAVPLNNEQLSLYDGQWHCDLYGHDYDDAVICRVCNHDGCEMGSQ